MPASLEDITAMVTFAKVVQTGSFTSAARELDLSKSAVSKRVAALEERLGLRLLSRSTRKLATTTAGEALYVRCARLLSEAEGAMDIAAAQNDAPHGLLRVNAPVLFGELHVAPLVPDLLRLYPSLRLDLTMTDAFIDPIAERQDVTIRIARLADSSMVARKLCEDWRRVVGSPEYFSRAGVPTTPTDLLQHECLRFSRMTVRDEWRFLRAPVGLGGRVTQREDEVSVPVTGRLSTDSGAGNLAAAIAGVGLAVLPQFMVVAALHDGSLISVLDEWMPRGYGIYALHGHHLHVPPKVRVFLEAITERARGFR